MEPKLFIGPMSKNIVDATIEHCNDKDISMGIIPSRRQIEFDGGYVNNWTTEKFSKYVKEKTNKIVLVRDHGGPHQGDNLDDGLESLKHDCCHFDIIHIDVWKAYPDFNDALKKTAEYVNFCYELNPNILFEIGTEQSIRPMTSEEVDNFLSFLSLNLKSKIFNRIKYVVIQSGTYLKGVTNIGKYNENKLKKMLDVVKKYNCISKEHNGDYLPSKLIKEKFALGLESINIAPEFGHMETKIIMNKMKESPEMVNKFYKMCHESNRWIKWVPKNYKVEENKEEVITISGHYVFSNPEFIKLREQLKISDTEIKNKIKEKIDDISF